MFAERTTSLRHRLRAPRGAITAVATPAPFVALTFDDGPHPVGTPAALAVLDRHRATATFFVLLSAVRRAPHLLMAISDAGHEIALHGDDHSRLTEAPTPSLSPRLAAARAELEDRVQARVRWFRPPYGATDTNVLAASRAAGLQTVLWGPSLWDWKDAGAQGRERQSMRGLRRGAIVLGHDGIASSGDGAGDEGASLPPDRSVWWEAALSRYAGVGLGARSLGEVAATGRLVNGLGRARRPGRG